MDYTDVINILAQTVRLSVPLILACLAGLYSERAGIVMIYKAYESMSFALVMDSTHEIKQGDRATNP